MTHILVIDDDPAITILLKTVLSDDIHRVQTVNKARDGLRLLREYTFDIVITDIIMPDLDGFEIIMEINKMQPRPRLIAMTGGSEKLSKEYLTPMVTAMKIQSLLIKPFTIIELKEAVFPTKKN